jgi:hypothetical protein
MQFAEKGHEIGIWFPKIDHQVPSKSLVHEFNVFPPLGCHDFASVVRGIETEHEISAQLFSRLIEFVVFLKF